MWSTLISKQLYKVGTPIRSNLQTRKRLLRKGELPKVTLGRTQGLIPGSSFRFLGLEPLPHWALTSPSLIDSSSHQALSSHTVWDYCLEGCQSIRHFFGFFVFLGFFALKRDHYNFGLHKLLPRQTSPRNYNAYNVLSAQVTLHFPTESSIILLHLD